MSSAASERPTSPDTVRVLLAEDDALAQRAIATYLAAAPGMKLVGVAADGVSAIQLARSVPADVAIVDIHLPKLDGIEVTRQLTSPPLNLKVLCFTALASDAVLMDALAAGASGFLLKSDSPELIQHGVRAALDGDALISPRLVQRVLATRRSRARPPADLSQLDLDLVRLVGRGLTNAQIGAELNYSTSTVKTYVSRLLGRLGRANRAALAALAYEWGLVGKDR